MITESGSIKATTEINEKMQKEFSHGTYNLGLAFTIIGAICAALFLSLELASIFLEIEGGYISLMIVSAVILGCGICIMSAVNKAVVTARNTRKLNVYEFYKDYFTVNEYLNGENVATAKFYNTQVIKAKETKNYIFFYINPSAACPIDKSQLSETEINTIRQIFRLPVSGGTVVLSAETLPPQNTEQADGAPPASTDPFDEFKN